MTLRAVDRILYGILLYTDSVFCGVFCSVFYT
eukprot:CAMPEP_0173317594 /NCGR_PEP_ID=MMETSP1143-20121109/27171_1 /TAXON_ID=483371 /ORGANISM="non described non described, Strain CCMP2298" /LENGTH=31 /DNA_ID= /DNA_START= /DNA_END= /DNA_ORIENTATION=